MKAFELTRKKKLEELSSDQRQFTAKMIVREVQKIAKEHNISEKEAYWGYTHNHFCRELSLI